MSRIVTTLAKLGPPIARLVPLAKQAWPILATIVAVLSDAFAGTGGAATPATLGLIAGGHVAAGRRRLDAVEALAAPLRPLGDVAEVPVFEFLPERGRLRAVALSLHGERYGLETGPALYVDAVAPGWDEDAERLWDDDDDDDDGDLDPHVATIPPERA